MINRLEAILKEKGIEAEIQIINDTDELLQYPTWVLPTLLINNKVVARGYLPSKETIEKFLVE